MLDDEHLRVLGTRYQLNENINTTRLMIPIVTINAVLVLSYSVAYVIFFPSLGQNAGITKELLNSINQYAPVAEFLGDVDPSGEAHLDCGTVDFDFSINAIDRRDVCSSRCDNDDVTCSSALLPILLLLVREILAVALLVTDAFAIVARLAD
ncbi:unnamed protein product [Toxocara canis]|uniref:Transmembrane protein n=1 Tax=Toxocara canis TaxID=6265 RepID=A0A183U0G2_TOXCA|nr:unnamed protein product [Toxocara canis]